MKDRIKVVFFDREYSVLTDAEESYLMKIVDYLEQKITRAAKDNEPNEPIAVPAPVFLASLEIVDDFFALQREFDEFKRNAERKTQQLVGLLESPGSQKEPVLIEESPEDPFKSRGNSF